MKILLEPISVIDLHNLIQKSIQECLAEIPKKQPSQQSEYLSRKEVSKFLKISLPTLLEYTKKGILIGYRIGGRVLYKQDEVKGSLKEIRSVKYRRGA